MQISGANEFEPAADFIKQRFLEQSTSTQHKIYPHLTCAISTENVKFVFKCVKETLLNDVLENFIL
jgi:hypothetical protein